MSKKRSLKPTLPSFEDLTAKPKSPEIPARIHAPAAPLRKPPGEMRVFGANPAHKWFENLSYTDPALSKELVAQVENLKGAEFGKAIWTAYTKHLHAADRSPSLLRFDFSKLFE